MGTRITANTGNGEIKPDSVFTYSYSEDVTSLTPSDNKGGTSQVTLSAIAVDGDKVAATHPDSKLLINNVMELTDDENGSVTFQVTNVGVSNGAVNITGDTIASRLNVNKIAQPVHGVDAETPASLLDAIEYYCSLVGITPQFDDGLDADLDVVPVNFIGWKGNLWEHLKMLCSAVSAATYDDNPFEMYISGNTLRFRYAGQSDLNYSGVSSELSVNVNAFTAAKSVGIYNYNTSYGEDKVMYDLANYEPTMDSALAFQSSINETLQVDAGKTVVKRVYVDASLSSINQPTCVETITRTWPSPYADGGLGEYVVVGSDDLPISPTEWAALGGKLTVALTENPNEIEITIVAPDSVTMPTADNPTTEVTNAPYKIGSELGLYPAIWLTGTGVFFNKQKKTFLTGASDLYTSEDEAATIDNPFITNLHDLSNRGVAAAQAYCGPSVTVTRSVVNGTQFGATPGSTERIGSNRYRYESASYSPDGVQLTGKSYATITDFNEKWVDKTFDDFNAVALEAPSAQALKFNEFTVIPLMESN
jgi:hypothetical protein